MSTSRQVQVLWGQLEDMLQRWGRRNPAYPHRDYDMAARKAIVLCGELAAQVEFELTEYLEHKQTGE